PLMDDNHELLTKINVSSPELDKLVEAAREAGALGAKLIGAGRGGNMMALADGNSKEIRSALMSAGASRAFFIEI
ncbi:MAG: mevalonate kinase, partial [archaeon]